jgi:hypothetical protein
VVSYTPRTFYPHGKSPRYPLDRRLVGPQGWSGRGGEHKNAQSLPGLEPPIIQPVAQRCTTELSWLPVFISYTMLSAEILAKLNFVKCIFSVKFPPPSIFVTVILNLHGMEFLCRITHRF